MVLLLVTLLSAAPVHAGGHVTQRPAQSVELRTQVDWFGMVSSYWYVPQSRVHIEALLDNARGTLRGDADLNGQGLLRATPVVGPWMTAASRDLSLTDSDRLLLCASGMMQLIGLTLGTMSVLQPMDELDAKGPVLRISPIAGGQLGVSVRIVGF